MFDISEQKRARILVLGPVHIDSRANVICRSTVPNETDACILEYICTAAVP